MWQMIGQTSNLSHFKRANQISSRPVEPAGNSVRPPLDVFCLAVSCEALHRLTEVCPEECTEPASSPPGGCTQRYGLPECSG